MPDDQPTQTTLDSAMAPAADAGAGGAVGGVADAGVPAAPQGGGQPAMDAGTPAAAQGSAERGASAPAQTVDWQARFTQVNDQYTAAQRDLGRFQGIDPDRARQALEQAERAASVPADVFAASHPERAKTMESVRRAGAFLNAIDAMPEDQRKLYGPAMAKKLGVSHDDLQAHEKFERRRQSFERELYEDPDAFVTSRVQQIVEQTKAEIYGKLQAEAKVAAWSDKNKPILAYAAEINQLTSDELPLSQKAEIIGAKLARLDELEKMLGERARTGANAAAVASMRGEVPAQGGNIADANRKKITDAPTYLRDVLKLTPDNPQYTTKLLETNAKIRAGQL